MGEPGAHDGIEQRDPDHVAGDGDAEQLDSADSDHRMPRKLTSVTMFASKLMPSVSVLSTKSRMSSAIRWSGLSVPMAARSVVRLMR